MIDKEAIEAKLREYKPILERQYCVKKIGVFGSYARKVSYTLRT